MFSCDFAARRFSSDINYYAIKYEIKPDIVFATIDVESGFNPRAKSSAGAIGLMQIMPSTAEWVAVQIGIDFYPDNLYNPQTNLLIGCFYLKYLFEKFSEDWQVFASYNAGENRVLEWIDNDISEDDIPYKETYNYVKKVKKRQKYYQNKKFVAFN